MRISRCLRVALTAVLLGASGFRAGAGEPELDIQMRHNRLLRLTGAQISITAGQHLIASFVEENGSTNVITVSFATGRSIPTRRTVENIIRGAIDWQTPPRRGLETTWHLPKAEVIFSAPTNLVDGDFSGWFLSSPIIPKTNALERASTPAVSAPTNWPVLVNGTNVPKTFRFRPTKVEFHDRGTRRQSFTVVFKIEDPQVPADYFTDFCWDTEVDMFKALPTADDGYITVTAWTVTGPSPQQFRTLPPFTLDGRVLQGLLHRSPPPPR